MSDVKLNCPHCSQSLEAPEEILGQTVPCPSCHREIELPRPMPPLVVPVAAPLAAPAPKTKDCPFCSERILATAKKCKHCGEFLEKEIEQDVCLPASSPVSEPVSPSNRASMSWTFIFSYAFKDMLHRLLHGKTEPTPQPQPHISKPFRTLAAIVFCMCSVGGVILGNVHIITGSQVPDGFVFIKKGSFGFTETFINLDEIMGMPALIAKSRFPISVHVLQREGIIQSEKQHFERIRKEVDASVRELLNK